MDLRTRSNAVGSFMSPLKQRSNEIHGLRIPRKGRTGQRHKIAQNSFPERYRDMQENMLVSPIVRSP